MDASPFQRRICCAILTCAGVLNSQYHNVKTVQAQEFLIDRTPEIVVSPLQDDATLRDVQLIGQRQGWTVGDRGAIWKTEDGGANWKFQQPVPHLQSYSLESICFLTDRVGWIAGGTVSPVGRVPMGVVLATNDSGENWTVVSSRVLPYIRKIQFFDMDHGVAVGERNRRFPSGVMVTHDGGRTWTAASSDKNAQWNDATFFIDGSGLVVGNQGTQSNYANESLFAGGANIGGLQAIQAVTSTSNGAATLVGDGSLILTSRDRGVTWSPPRNPLPKEFNNFVEFHCVEQRDRRIWIGGSPGSVIWHSADDGQSWQPQSTGDSAPLSSIAFSDPQHGVAVGHFGRICVTADGGATWANVRGQNRRLACWALHGRAARIPFSFLTRWAREAGYRTAVTLAVRRDLGVDAHMAIHEQVQLDQAVLTAGGNSSDIDWRLPVSLPGLDRNKDRLYTEWSALTDHKLPDVMLSHLVAQIRMWKPEVILLNEPDSNDAISAIIHQALPIAVDQAADPNRFPEQIQLGLSPWSVRKVAMERNLGQRGTISQNGYEILPHVGTTLDVATLEAAQRLLAQPPETASGQNYEVLYVAPGSTLSKTSFFNDLQLPMDSAARRKVPAIRSMEFERLIDDAQHRRMLTSISEQMIERPGQGGQLIGQLREMMQPLSDEQAARQLADVALKFRKAGQWAMAEETYAELIINYPDQPPALEAMLWLVEFLSSVEMNWQRLRTTQASKSQLSVSPEILQVNFGKALEMAKKNATQTGFFAEAEQLTHDLNGDATPLVPTLGTSPGVLNGSAPGANQYDLQLQRWHDLAARMVKDLSEAYPHLFSEDQMQFVVAALYRRQKQARQADEIYGRYLQRLGAAEPGTRSIIEQDPWYLAASGETYLLRPGAVSPKPVVTCRTTLIPPVLDGLLDDACWTEARELKLGNQSDQELFVGENQSVGGSFTIAERKPIVMFSRDAEYLYIAATVPKHQEVEYEPTMHGGRLRDADLSMHDYITIQLDVDRDYATYYRFDIDQRGWTREACWEAWGYNPQWFVASQQDPTSWTVEAAIPLEELLPSEPNLSSTWAIGVTRVAPATQVQSWTSSGGEHPLPARFGFMRFE